MSPRSIARNARPLIAAVVLVFLALGAGSAAAATGDITRIAGTGTAGYNGDNIAPASAQLSFPIGLWPIPGGFYVADQGNYRIRLIQGGIIKTVAGDGTPGFSSNNTQATVAKLNAPSGVAQRSTGELLITDSNNNVVREVSLGNEPTLSTVAGTGAAGFSGDNGQATNAKLSFPIGIVTFGNGGYLIVDTDNHRIRHVYSNGTIDTFAGNGSQTFAGDNGPAPQASLNKPTGIAALPNGDILIADSQNQRIRKVHTGVITTVAGTGVAGFSGDNGPATAAQLSTPTSVAARSDGSYVIADRYNHRIRMVSPGGTITTLAGTGSAGLSGDNGPATSAKLNQPTGVAVTSDGDVLISDTFNHEVRLVDLTDTQPQQPTVVSAPTLSGIPKPNSTLTCNPGTFTGGPVTRSYVWELAPRAVTSADDPAWQPRAGQTNTSYVVRSDEQGLAIRCREVAVNGGGTATAPSNSKRVDADVPRLTAGGRGPRLDDYPLRGRRLTCLAGDWDNAGDFAYTWWRRLTSVTAPAEYTLVASGAEYTPSASDTGYQLGCTITATNDVGYGASASSDGTIVIDGVPQWVTRPLVDLTPNGPRATDQLATCIRGPYRNDYGIYRYQWYRNDDAIAGATERTYQATVDDLGRLLKCVVFTSNPLGDGPPAGSDARLVPLPASGSEGRLFVGVNGENWLASTSMVAVSTEQLDAIKPVIRARYTDALAARRTTCAAATKKVGATFAATYGLTLSDAQTCSVIHSPFLKTSVDGVFWAPEACVTTLRVSYPSTFTAGQKIDGHKVAPPEREIGGSKICPKLAIDIPKVDLGRDTVVDPTLALAVGSVAPKEVLWDLNGDGLTDASCGPDAPVLRTIPERGVYPKLRAVIVGANSAETGQYGVASLAFDFSFGGGNPGRLRAAQAFACRTTVDPPAREAQPCLSKATLGRVVVQGNLCPVASATIPPKELEALPDDVRGIIETGVLKDSAAATARAVRAAAWRQAPSVSVGHSNDLEWLERTTGAVTQLSAAEIPESVIEPALKKRLEALGFHAEAGAFASDQIYLARGPVTVNGVKMTPQGEAATVLVPSDVHNAMDKVTQMTIASTASALTMLGPKGRFPIGDPGAFKAEIRDQVVGGAQEFASRGLNDLKSELAKNLKENLDLGPFDLSDNIDVKLNNDGTASIHASADLDLFTDPASGKSLSGEVDIDADLGGHLSLKTIHIHAPRALLGPVELRDIDLLYDGGLSVTGKILFGPGSQGIEITRFHLTKDGEFDGLGLKYLAGIGQGIPIGPGLFLTQIGGQFDLPGLDFKQGRIQAFAALSAGTSVGSGCPAAGLEGTVDLNWIYKTEEKKFSIDALAKPVIVCVHVGEVKFHADTGGFVSVNGTASLDVGPLETSGNITAQLQLERKFKDSRFQLEVTGNGKIVGLLDGTVKGILSNKGLAGCGSVTVVKVPLVDKIFGKTIKITVAGGVGERFIDGIPPVTPAQVIAGLDLFAGCDLSDYKTFTGARAAQSGGRVVPVAKGQKLLALSIIGAGGVPKVKITTPDGRVLDYTDVPEQLTAMPTGSSAMALPASGRLMILLAAPLAGDWKIDPVEGSPAIADVQTATALPAPKVRTSVTGHGSRRVLRYKVAKLAGQSVRFVESATGGQRVIKEIKGGGTGRVPFTVSEGSGTRRIVAEVTQDGLPRATLRLTRFTAPAPKVGTVRRLRAVRKGHRVTVSWRAATNAKAYLVGVTRQGGRRESYRPEGKRLRVVLTGIGAREPLKITVVAQSAAGRSGRKAVTRSRPAARRKRHARGGR